ncbi:phage tail tape measure C-terminal domain-containing protein [Paracoccus sp. ME4]|uniref:phage tail tape measure C-terminal domain-containing protein n=1 Tax=Paracoccus sp. ME4 TaxID=3138066 RepID=UPI00398B9A6F
MSTDLRARLTVTADASALVAEMRRGSEGLREIRRETEAASAAAAQAATEQGRMAERLGRTFNNFSAAPRSARDSFGVFEAARELQAFEQEQAANAARAYRVLEESLNPVTRAQRELADAQAVVNRALAAGQVTNAQASRSLQQLEDRYQGFVRAHSPAVQSAQAMERAIEAEAASIRQLTLALDPAARAAQEFEQAQQQVQRAVRMNIITQEEATRVMGLLEARQQSVGASGVTMGMGVQNASFQLADFAVQVQAGQSASLALAQQLPQLLGGFGVLGAVLGAVVAVGVPLIKMFVDTGDAAGSLDDRLDRLEQSSSAVTESLKRLRDENLGVTFGSMAGAVREMTEAMLALDRAAQLKSLRETLDELLTKNVEPSFIQRTVRDFALASPTAGEGAREELTRRISAANYAELTGGRGPTFDEFEARRTEIDALAKAGDVRRVIEEVNALIREFTNGGPVSELNAGLTEVLGTIGEVAIKTAEVEAQFNGTAQAAEFWSTLVAGVQGHLQAAVDRARELRAEGDERIRVAQDELSLNQVIARFGADSQQAETERSRIAREAYEIELERAGIMGDQRDRLMEIYDQNVSVTNAAGDWAARMADVRAEIGGILAGLASLAGGVVDRAAKAAELQALNAGGTVADAAARGQQSRRDAEQKARLMAANNPLERAAAMARNWWDNTGAEQDAALDAARSAAREREAAERRSQGGRSGGGAGGRGRSAASAGASITAELARLAPSYEADVAAAQAWREKALEQLNATRGGYAQFAEDVERIYQERLSKAYEDDLKRRDDWNAGVERGLLDVQDKMLTWADVSESLVTGWAKGAEDAFVRFGQTGKASMQDLVDFTIEQFLRLSYQQTISPAINAFANWATSALGSAFGMPVPGAGGAAPISTNHTGSPGVMRSYGLNGFGDRMRADEKLAMVRDGEEIMTSRALENAGALISNLSAMASKSQQPVMMAQGGGGPMTVIVKDYSGGTQAEEGTDSRGNPTLTMTIGRQMAAAAGQPGNPFGRAFEARYGVRKQGIAR